MDTNRSGQAGGFLALTPIRAGEVEALRSHLEAMAQDSPLARVPSLHTGRFVIVEDFAHDPAWGQRREEHLATPHLVFSTNHDGPLATHLDEVARAFGDSAAQVWGRCHGCPSSPTPDELVAYLRHNQVDAGVFYAAYGDATVAQVQHALRQRERLVDFAVRTQGWDPVRLQKAFVQEFVP